MGMQARSDTLCEQETTTVSTEKIMQQDRVVTSGDRSVIASTSRSVGDDDSDEDEFHDCLSWAEGDLEVGVDAEAANSAKTDKPNCICSQAACCRLSNSICSLPKSLKDSANFKTKWLNRQMPPHKVAPDGTTVHYWCDVPVKRASFDGHSRGMFFDLSCMINCFSENKYVTILQKVIIMGSVF